MGASDEKKESLEQASFCKEYVQAFPSVEVENASRRVVFFLSSVQDPTNSEFGEYRLRITHNQRSTAEKRTHCLGVQQCETTNRLAPECWTTPVSNFDGCRIGGKYFVVHFPF